MFAHLRHQASPAPSRNLFRTGRWWLALGMFCGLWPDGSEIRGEEPRFVDLSLLIAPEYPCTWTTFPPFQINHYRQIGPLSAYNSDILIIDGNTGTQLDVPPHSVTAPNAGPFGLAFTDKIEAWQFGGEACVIDCQDLLDSTPAGRSDLVTRERIQAWEKANRPLRRGDVVLFHSGFSDKYYRPFPEGRRFGADPVAGLTPGWPDPDPDCMEYLASRGVLSRLSLDCLTGFSCGPECPTRPFPPSLIPAWESSWVARLIGRPCSMRPRPCKNWGCPTSVGWFPHIERPTGCGNTPSRRRAGGCRS